MNRNLIIVLISVPVLCFGQSFRQDSLRDLLSSRPESEHAQIYNELASLHLDEGDYPGSVKMAGKALALSREYNNEHEQFRALTYIAFSHYDQGHIDTSIYYANEAYKIATAREDPLWIARVCNHLGNAYSRISIFDKALSNYLTSLRIIEDTLPGVSDESHLRYKALVLNNIGTVYESLGRKKEALEVYTQSLKIRRQQNDLNGIASCLQNIGVIYESNGSYDSTLMLYHEALEIRRSLNQKNYIGELLMNIGIVSIQTMQYDVAESNLKEAVRIFRDVENQRLLAFSYMSLAELYIERNMPDPAYPFITKSIDLCELYGYKEFERDAYKILSDYYAQKRDFKQAWESQQKQIALTDSIFNSELSAKVTEMQTKYELENKEKEIALLTRDKEIQSLVIRRKSTQVYILVIAVILFILLLVITLLLLSRRKLKQKQYKVELEKSLLIKNKMQEEIAHQSKQLTTHALHMLQKNKLLQELDEELRVFTSKTDDSLRKKLNSIRRQINKNMNSEKDWDLFKMYFEEVHRDFFSALHKRSEDLTTGDLKLAALIRLNLNIKEAAAVLNISPESLKKARYRLRKKLGLFDRENLADCINNV